MTKSPRSRRTSLTDRLNYWGIKDGSVVTRTKGIETAVEFTLPTAAQVTEAERENLKERIRAILVQAIPEKCRGRLIIECAPVRQSDMLQVDPDSIVENDLLRSMAKTATAANERRRQAGELTAFRYYLTIRLENRQTRIKSVVPFVRSELDPLLYRAKQLRTQLVSMLNAGGFSARALSMQETFELIWRYHNPGLAAARAPNYKSTLSLPNVTTEQLKKDFSLLSNSMREQVAECDIDTTRIDSLIVGNRMVSTVSMYGRPDASEPGMPEHLLRRLAGRHFYYILDMEHLDQAQKNKELSSAARSSAVATVDTSLGPPDAGNNARLNNLTRVIYRIASEGERVFKMGICIVLVARDKAELEVMQEIARTEMSMMGGMRAALGTVQNLPQYADNVSPMNGRTNEFLVEAFSSNVADYFPNAGPWKGSSKPVVTFRSRYGTLTGLNPSDGTTNYGTLVFGSAGSGKSFWCQNWVVSTASLGADVIIVDQKQDYLSLMTTMGGQFIPFAPGESVNGQIVRYNAFELEEGQSEPDIGHKMFLLAFITSLLGTNEVSIVDRSIITATIDQVYETNASRGTDGVIRQTQVVTLGMFVRTLSNLNAVGNVTMRGNDELRAAATRLSVALQQFIGSTPMGSFFDGPSTIDLSNRYLYFDISKIKSSESLTRTALLLIIRLIWNRAKTSNAAMKVALIEELGVLFNMPEAMEFVAELYKLGRAYGLWPVGASQEIGDMQKAKGLINNTSQFIIGKVGAEEAAQLVQVLGLNDAAHDLILSLSGEKGVYREFLALTATGSGVTGDVIQYFPNAYEYWMFTSAPDDKARRAAAVEAFGGNVNAAVKALAGMTAHA